MREWKSRVGVEPPTEFFSEALAYLANAFPRAMLDRETVRSLRPFLVKQWRIGQNGGKAAAATCACDGTRIVPSPGSQVTLPSRALKPPLKAMRGDVFGVDDLREIGSLRNAKLAAEVADRQVEYYKSEVTRLEVMIAEGSKQPGLTRMLAQARKRSVSAAQDAAKARATAARLTTIVSAALPAAVIGEAGSAPATQQNTPAGEVAAEKKPRGKRPKAPKTTSRKQARCEECAAPQIPEPIPSEDQATLAGLVADFAQAQIDDLKARGG